MQDQDTVKVDRSDWLLLTKRVETYKFSQNQVRALEQIRMGFVRGTEKRPQIFEVRLQPSRDGGGSFFAVVKGFDGDGYQVGYHAGLGLFPMLVELGRRIGNGSLKWREDQYPPKKPPQMYSQD